MLAGYTAGRELTAKQGAAGLDNLNQRFPVLPIHPTLKINFKDIA